MSQGQYRLPEQREFCHKCDAETVWKPVRGGQATRCVGCKDRFPCQARKCGHGDCEEARFYLAGLEDEL